MKKPEAFTWPLPQTPQNPIRYTEMATYRASTNCLRT